eukprot:CAMPEP_0172828286 /NCGR_PEP_ID=MMETSP1075-20121228/20744_1 /TAXON_ID=2916 /ORGANISM="Ceratium fusus, Strain PA161109" /LENGTH=193 /DNA_ID=CAMNT_0013670263 /DNA_START=55 /DNA_END=634 /DNA_ORIENTATION=+
MNNNMGGNRGLQQGAASRYMELCRLRDTARAQAKAASAEQFMVRLHSCRFASPCALTHGVNACGLPVSGVGTATCCRGRGHGRHRHHHPGHVCTRETCVLMVSAVGNPSMETCALMVTFASMVTSASMVTAASTATSLEMATDCRSGPGHHHGASPGSSHSQGAQQPSGPRDSSLTLRRPEDDEPLFSSGIQG